MFVPTLSSCSAARAFEFFMLFLFCFLFLCFVVVVVVVVAVVVVLIILFSHRSEESVQHHQESISPLDCVFSMLLKRCT